ncbi:MAG: hypothetical protein ACP5RS_06735 [Thermoplasmata archaeon]
MKKIMSVNNMGNTKEVFIKVVNVPIDYLTSKITEFLTAKGYTIKKKEVTDNTFEIELDVPLDVKNHPETIEYAFIKGKKDDKELGICLQTSIKDGNNAQNNIDKKLLTIYERWKAWKVETTVWSGVRQIVRDHNGLYSPLKNKSVATDSKSAIICYYCGSNMPEGSLVCPNCGHISGTTKDPLEMAYILQGFGGRGGFMP